MIGGTFMDTFKIRMEPSAAIHCPISAERDAQEHSHVCISPHPWFKNKKQKSTSFFRSTLVCFSSPVTALRSSLRLEPRRPLEKPLLDPRPGTARQLKVAKTLGSFVWLCGKSYGQSCWNIMQPKPSRRWSGWNIWFSVTPGLKSWRELPDMSVREHSLGFILTSASSPARKTKITIYVTNNKNNYLNTVQRPK